MGKVAILLLGPPASGKGTQAGLLSRKFELPHVSLGEILRSNVEHGGEFAEQAKSFLAAGKSVPVQLMGKVLRKSLGTLDKSQGFIGDGLVRSFAQALELDAILAELCTSLCFVFHIRIPYEEILLRTRHRMWCPRCGASYRRDSGDTNVMTSCPIDDIPLAHRSDDSEKIVEMRIRAHEKSLPAIIAHYRKRNIFYDVDGKRAINAVHAEILSVCAPPSDVHP
jgi:adenylate kinase